jgi:ribonuclease P protein component
VKKRTSPRREQAYHRHAAATTSTLFSCARGVSRVSCGARRQRRRVGVAESRHIVTEAPQTLIGILATNPPSGDHPRGRVMSRGPDQSALRPGRDQTGEHPHQADVPAQEAVSAQDPRVSRPDGHAWRTAGAEGTASQGPQAPHSRAVAVNRRQRLSGRARFAAVRSGGAEIRIGGLRVRALPHPDAASRAGFAVRGARGAVDRNRVRRRLREAVTPLLRRHPGYDIVVSSSVVTPEPAFDVMAAHLELGLTRAIEKLERR